jgi:hypothetical protein
VNFAPNLGSRSGEHRGFVSGLRRCVNIDRRTGGRASYTSASSLALTAVLQCKRRFVSIQTSRLFAFRPERSDVAECREIDFGTVPKYRFAVAEFHWQDKQ